MRRAYKRAVRLGLRTENQHAQLVLAISEFHEKFVFRYPVLTKEGELIIIKTLVKAEDVLEIVKKIWRAVEIEVIKARLLSASAGEYPIEEWHMGSP